MPQDPTKRVGFRSGTTRRYHGNGGFDRHPRQAMHALLPEMMRRLGENMKVRLLEVIRSDDDEACVERCFQELRATVMKLGPRWRLEVFGSVASGFSTSGSDMDATCVQVPSEDKDENEDTPSAAIVLCDRLSPLLREHERFQVIEEILSAKVPILRLRFEGHVDIDLSCQNTAALLNTRLLRAYADLDSRVKDLGIAVKLWAKAARVCGASQGNLSSYTFTLMVIYFMQVHNEVNLPCIRPLLFEDSDAETVEAELSNIQKKWSCHLTLPDLLFRFMGFYTLFFDWGREVVSVRLGRRLYSRDNAFQTLRGRYVSRFHVEDPYNLERNLHCVLGEAEEVQLREAFHGAWHALVCGGTPVGLRPLGVGQPLELQLHELTGHFPPGNFHRSPVETCAVDSENTAQDLDTANDHDETHPEDEVGFHDLDDNRFNLRAPKAEDDTQSPGGYTSSGSTESGDDKCVPHEPCTSSSGDSRLSDDEYAAKNEEPGHGKLALEEEPQEKLEVDSAAANLGPKQWWQNLGSEDVMKAIQARDEANQATAPHEEPERAQTHPNAHHRFLSLEDLENQMVHWQGEEKAPAQPDAEVEEDSAGEATGASTEEHATACEEEDMAAAKPVVSPKHMGIADKVKRSLAAANAATAAGCETPPAQVLSTTAPSETGTSLPLPSPVCAADGSEWWRNLGSADVKQAIDAVAPQEDSVQRTGKWNRRKARLTVQDLEDRMAQEPQHSENVAEATPLQITSMMGGSFSSTSSSKIAARINNCFVQASVDNLQ